MYTALKYSHLLFIGTSLFLFQLRFLLKVLKTPVGKALKIVPHINDTLLLATGLVLTIYTEVIPWEHNWLGYKLVALVFYIGFGMVALKSKGFKSFSCYLVATALFIFMIFTALNKTPFTFGI